MKHKLENGEVIEAFRKQFDMAFQVMASTLGHKVEVLKPTTNETRSLFQKDIEAFITNALNQQRIQIAEMARGMKEEMKVSKIDYKWRIKGWNDAIDEFLTKLEE